MIKYTEAKDRMRQELRRLSGVLRAPGASKHSTGSKRSSVKTCFQLTAIEEILLFQMMKKQRAGNRSAFIRTLIHKQASEVLGKKYSEICRDPAKFIES